MISFILLGLDEFVLSQSGVSLKETNDCFALIDELGLALGIDLAESLTQVLPHLRALDCCNVKEVIDEAQGALNLHKREAASLT